MVDAPEQVIANAPDAEVNSAALKRHGRVRRRVQHQRVADLQLKYLAQRLFVLIEHGAHFELGVPKLAGEVTFPDVVATELLTHELLQQHFADGFERCVRQQQQNSKLHIIHHIAFPI